MVLTYFLNDFEMAPVAPIITGITLVFTFHIRCIVIIIIISSSSSSSYRNNERLAIMYQLWFDVIKFSVCVGNENSNQSDQSWTGVDNLRHACQTWHAERFSVARWVNWNTVIMISYVWFI
jgi:hypothetical protein